MAEMDLLQLQAFADNLAGVVLDQVEADRGLNREKIANAMMGHIVKFGIEQRRAAWDIGAEWLGKQAQRKGFRASHPQDVKAVTVQLYRLDEKGQRQPVVMTPDNARHLELAIRCDRPVEVINGDTWFFPDGLVMTGMELAQIGRTAVEIWEIMRRRTSMFEASGIGKRSVWADFIERKNKEQP